MLGLERIYEHVIESLKRKEYFENRFTVQKILCINLKSW